MHRSPLSLYAYAELLRLYVCWLFVNSRLIFVMYIFVIYCQVIGLLLTISGHGHFPKLLRKIFKRDRPPRHIILGRMIEFCGNFPLYLIQVELVHVGL